MCTTLHCLYIQINTSMQLGWHFVSKIAMTKYGFLATSESVKNLITDNLPDNIAMGLNMVTYCNKQ